MPDEHFPPLPLTRHPLMRRLRSHEIESVTASQISAGTITAQTIVLATDSDNTVAILKSDNYVADTSGWQIDSDGNAEFNDVTVRGDVYGNWDGADPVDLSSTHDATATTGFAGDSSAGAWQFMGSVWIGGDLTLIGTGKLATGTSGNNRAELIGLGVTWYDTLDAEVSSIGLTSEEGSYVSMTIEPVNNRLAIEGDILPLNGASTYDLGSPAAIGSGEGGPFAEAYIDKLVIGGADTDTYAASDNPDQWNFYAGGVEMLRLTEDTNDQVFVGPAGSEPAPALALITDPDTGPFWPADDEWAVAVGGDTAIQITEPTAASHRLWLKAGTRSGESDAFMTDPNEVTGGFLTTRRTMNTTSSQWVPGLLFGSTDPNFTTHNPKVLAHISAEVTEPFTADTDSGIELVFFSADNNGGADPTLEETLRVGVNTFTYKTNTIWHAGNDGAGSGLNADTVDGSHASAFVTTASHTTSLHNGMGHTGHYGGTTATAANAVHGSSTSWLLSTSSEEVKRDIRPFRTRKKGNPLLEITPILFRSALPADDSRVLRAGLSAENISAVFPEAYTETPDPDGGEPIRGWETGAVVAALIDYVQRLEERVYYLEGLFPGAPPGTTTVTSSRSDR